VWYLIITLQCAFSTECASKSMIKIGQNLAKIIMDESLVARFYGWRRSWAISAVLTRCFSRWLDAAVTDRYLLRWSLTTRRQTLAATVAAIVRGQQLLLLLLGRHGNQLSTTRRSSFLTSPISTPHWAYNDLNADLCQWRRGRGGEGWTIAPPPQILACRKIFLLLENKIFC